MRNNPQHGHHLEYQDPFVKYARIEKIRRFFTQIKQRLYKHFCIQPYQANFTKKHIKEYILHLDAFLQMEGKLVKHFKTDGLFKDLTDMDVVAFEDLYDLMA